MSRPKPKVVITCSIKGAIHTPSMSPYFPITPGEFAQATDHERLKARFNELLLKIIVLCNRHGFSPQGLKNFNELIFIKKQCGP